MELFQRVMLIVCVVYAVAAAALAVYSLTVSEWAHAGSFTLNAGTGALCAAAFHICRR